MEEIFFREKMKEILAVNKIEELRLIEAMGKQNKLNRKEKARSLVNKQELLAVMLDSREVLQIASIKLSVENSNDKLSKKIIPENKNKRKIDENAEGNNPVLLLELLGLNLSRV